MRNVSGEASFAYTDNGVTHFVTWSDATAIATKVKLAKTLGLKGVAIFKVDGMGDPALWNTLK
jgi:spore germination protein YaaH